MLLVVVGIVNCLCEGGTFSFATCFKRVKDGNQSVLNGLIITWRLDHGPASYVELGLLEFYYKK